ncbi:TerC family protein [Corynebacterium diphtheriae]|uniref:TerC family protein n=1 Tax=Corynebacterium diphtheriae TaxID=1717 RepID=UPI00092AF7F1|nr:TerC family protein [Corynebacterium diphtheriae]APM35636.1 tellurium resistance protein TerC [Corynebacterium diphtheriae]MCS6570978.1 TerC family protein [Corynebacterium diphtheriae]OJH89026.1 tellurium resistance protein TerC [Corynebacterium diphtheriae]OJH90433.1 tellurium resistance protein TerC [Corynebacterium diphtheriae]OJH99108.1 tellurium resistance protein TerC [Corynebacterium diphtheriae]
MEVNVVTWVITIAVIAGFFVFDFFSHVRTPHEPTLKESALWSVFYVVLACAFGVFLWLTWGEPGNPHQHGIEFFTGYVTEKALSVDNLFVFALIMGAFKIPRQYQQKVLLIGIALALVFRLVFILLGAAVIQAWSDVFYLFGIFLLYTALKLIWDEVTDKPETDPSDMRIIKWLRKVVHVTPNYEKDHLYIHQKGKFALTPLFIALVAIGMIDLMFAFDSIPAIYGITQEPYVVFTTNAFALLGLRQMYFLLDGLLDRLVYLAYGLGLILAFIGAKLLLHAMHENKLPFVNGGEPIAVPEIATHWSLVVIVGILAITIVASIIKSKRDDTQGVVR